MSRTESSAWVYFRETCGGADRRNPTFLRNSSRRAASGLNFTVRTRMSEPFIGCWPSSAGLSMEAASAK
ncbi:MAG: hypothetical protein PUG09_02060 [Prevotella sp.]|nr:hypothetical protein [Prevotella sp.]